MVRKGGADLGGVERDGQERDLRPRAQPRLLPRFEGDATGKAPLRRLAGQARPSRTAHRPRIFSQCHTQRSKIID